VEGIMFRPFEEVIPPEVRLANEMNAILEILKEPMYAGSHYWTWRLLLAADNYTDLLEKKEIDDILGWLDPFEGATDVGFGENGRPL
jgi:hypothetical protein